jgi:endonuclease/exonuclease/phosphatase family metal-dependent hydrolase
VVGEAPAPDERAPLSELRIAAWNIAHGRGLAPGNWTGETREVRLERLRSIACALKPQKPDVVILNEVDFDASWSGRVNAAEVIVREMGMHCHAEGRNVDISLPFFQLRFGNAILSRFPIREARVVDFPGYSGLETFLAGKKRGLLCTLECPGGRQLRVLAVHLDHRSEEVRVSSARAIERLRTESDTPLIAAGDFNSTPENYPLATRDRNGRTALSVLLDGDGFRTLLKPTPTAVDFTFPADRPHNAIDWVLVPPNWNVIEHDPLDLRLSDHRPVVARLAPPVGQ